MNKALNLRNKVTEVFEGKLLFDHQREAAQKTFNALTGDVRAVVMTAEMQAGKSGISLALSCLQRLSMSDEDICERTKLKDTLYLLTMPDTALLDQAMKDLEMAKNAVVSNFNRFEQDLERYFKGKGPKLIVIDECHYGSNAAAIRYCRVFDYLEKENDDCKVVFISATPFGALYAAEQEYDIAKHMETAAAKKQDKELAEEAAKAAEIASKESILRRDFNTRLVFHRTSNEYFGVREMLKLGKVSNLDQEARNFTISSTQRNQIVNMIESHEGAGWVLVRVPPGTAMDAKAYFADIGVLPENNVFIIGKQLAGVPEEEHTSIDQFKRQFDECIDFDEKLIAITVAGFRAGINFGHEMKSHLIATWDSTVTSVAAVVQANIGRACGYHDNHSAHHFTNLDAAQAYAEILNYLEATTSEHAASDFDGLRDFFEQVCEEYNVNGLDVGLTVKYKKRRPIADVETYMTDSYVVVPGKLYDEGYDYSDHTDDSLTLSAIALLKEEFLKKGGPSVKGNRAMRRQKNWVKAQWVNGDTYNNKEKANKEGTMKERTIKFTNLIDEGKELEFNRVVQPGSGEYTETKQITATVFSIYNLSRRIGVKKKIMTTKDVHEMCDHFGIQHDDTLFVLYKRGDYDLERTEIKLASHVGPDSITTINDESQFSETERNA